MTSAKHISDLHKFQANCGHWEDIMIILFVGCFSYYSSCNVCKVVIYLRSDISDCYKINLLHTVHISLLIV